MVIMVRRVRPGKRAGGEVAAAEFKATCLELMDRVRETGTTYVVTKHGRPVAKLVPYDGPEKGPLFGAMKPMRSSSAAGAGALNDAPISTMAVSSGMEIQDIARFMVVSLAFRFPGQSFSSDCKGVTFGTIPSQPRRPSLHGIAPSGAVAHA